MVKLLLDHGKKPLALGLIEKYMASRRFNLADVIRIESRKDMLAATFSWTKERLLGFPRDRRYIIAKFLLKKAREYNVQPPKFWKKVIISK